RLSGIPEIVEDGVNGRLVPAEDAPALAAALRSLAEDPATRRRLGTAGIRRIAEGWDLEEGVTRLLTLLSPLLGQPTTTVPASMGVGCSP
ncbi:MAG TPA: glycosyltransferase, partial [Candidatus Methylomirabilis sp.]|nr:glycosyltransferase [Candidatus Methylomirabilis sp.]